MVGGANYRCTFYIWSNAFRGIKRPEITIWICQGTTAPTCPRRGLRVHFDTDSFCKERTDFILTSHNTPSIVVHCETYAKQPPPSLFHASSESSWLRHSSNKDPPTHTHTHSPTPSPLPLTTESAYDLPGGQAHSPQTVTECHLQRSLSVWRGGRAVKPPHCAAVWTGPSVLSVKSKALPPALWQSPLPLEPLIITCEGGLVIFLIILHFISIPPFKTQHENWLPQRSIFIIYPRAHKLSDFGAGWTSRAGTSRSLSQRSAATSLQCVGDGGGGLNGAALFCSLQMGGKKSTLVILWTLKHVR